MVKGRKHNCPYEFCHLALMFVTSIYIPNTETQKSGIKDKFIQLQKVSVHLSMRDGLISSANAVLSICVYCSQE